MVVYGRDRTSRSHRGEIAMSAGRENWRGHFHVRRVEKVPWVQLADDLRKYPHGGGG